ncbi:MAG: hypothetical protein ACRDNC_11055, partial [Gaiellaceae bacterium]
DVFAGLPFEALPALTGEQTFLVAAGLATLAGLALAVRASGPSAASVMSARFLLANAPPIPLRCMVGATANRASVAVAGASGSGGAGGVLGVRASGGNPVGGLAGKVSAIAGDVRDGFLHGAGRAVPGPADDVAGNTPLWMIAMMLGTVYLAFITACIWVAKHRWHVLR